VTGYDPAAELTPAAVRALLAPEQLLLDLGWLGDTNDLGAAIPVDWRGILAADAHDGVAVGLTADAPAVRATLAGVLDRAAGPIAVELVAPPGAAATVETDELAWQLRRAVPGLAGAPRAATDAPVLEPGEDLPWDWPREDDDVALGGVAYLLPGLPPEGSGGSHSIVQEARGLRGLGVDAAVCVPAAYLEVVHRVYGDDDGVFVTYDSDDAVVEAIGAATVVVATEHPSVGLLEAVAARRPEVLCAYYVQDYEPLFAKPESRRGDRALLSYRSSAVHLLFAKTHFLRNVVAARHGRAVAKVAPSLDRALFHPRGRPDGDGPLRVTAMVRPRTPRRRPRLTLDALAAVQAELGPGVEVTTFGCDDEALDELDAGAGEHVGALGRAQVAELMRHSDVFVDASNYQAFGRTGLEAMACGAVPVLPRLGGVGEFAVDGANALLVDAHDAYEIADAVVALAGDPGRLERLRAAGVAAAERFSIEDAAASQLALFKAFTRRRAASNTLPA
jgi:hypothetical protein